MRAGDPDRTEAPRELRIAIDPSLAEEVVFRALRERETGGDLHAAERYRWMGDAIYTGVEPESRKAAFGRLNLEFFARLGFESIVRECVEEFPRVKREVSLVALVKAQAGSDESADLRIARGEGPDGRGPARRTLFFKLLPGTFLGSPEALGSFFRHELHHIEDMLDPAFAYDPNEGALEGPSIEERVRIERYGALWAASIDRRMDSLGWRPLLSSDDHEARLRLVFPGVSPEAVRLFLDARGGRPTHRELMEAASNPAILHAVSGLAGAPEVQARCSICGFPYPAGALLGRSIPEAVADLVRTDIPSWAGEACERCVDFYIARAGLFPAPTALAGD